MVVLYRWLASKIPGLNLKLRQARMNESREFYVKKIFFTSFYLAFGSALIVFLLLRSFLAFFSFFVFFPLFFLYFVKYVDFKIQKLSNSINQEIIFAGRFLIIEIESGVPLYDAFVNLSKNYAVVGKFFGEIIEKVDLGTSMEDAINEAIILSPSNNLNKILWQVLNSMKTGSDISSSLNVVIDQIVREQQIAVKDYGHKLSPLAMFYMMIAIILPSLGTTIIVVVASFIGLSLSFGYLLIITGLIAFIQFMFLSIIKSFRPPMEL